MLFVRAGTEYRDAKGQTFRGWLESGRLASGETSRPTLSHWSDHLSTLFPEVRVKRVLELRGADMVPMPMLLALPALWIGLLYDGGAREAAWKLTRHWSFPALVDFQGAVARQALQARGPGGVLALDLARELVGIARAGLKGWQQTSGFDESAHLDPLSDILAGGRTMADRALEAWRSSGGDPDSLIRLWQVA
jgi:glutamate--cysteine ligase